MPTRPTRMVFRRPTVLLLGCLVGMGVSLVNLGRGFADDPPAGPRADAWKRVTRALDEGKPKTAAEALAGIEQAAAAERAWAEAARAIATRILAETATHPPDDPERIVRLAAAIEQAPAETRPVLDAIRANWTWGYFRMNRWRFQQRTAGGVEPSDLARINEWDLPGIVGEIRRCFAAALDGGAGLQRLPVGEWSAILAPGTMPDAYRPTVWDVVVRDALEFAASGERGLADPEDAFELDATSPALGTADEFLNWKPDEGDSVTDTASPILQAARLHRELLEFHAADADRTAFLAADLDRILWAAGAAVDAGDVTVTDRKADALEAFIDRAGDHEVAALALHELAQIARSHDDLVEARSLAARGSDRHLQSPGGRLCRNLVAELDARELSLATERTWAAPWPAIRVTYRNLGRVHLKLAKADWPERLRQGRPNPAWFDDEDRATIAGLPALKTAAIDLPATPDRIEVRLGETLRFRVRNAGKVMHEFVIGTKAENAKHAELMIKFPNMEHDEPYMAHVAPGKIGDIVWTFNRAGTFEFACLIAGHHAAGMVGVIQVIPA